MGARDELKKVNPVAPPGGKKKPCNQLIPGLWFHLTFETAISITVESQGFKHTKLPLTTVEPEPEI